MFIMLYVSVLLAFLVYHSLLSSLTLRSHIHAYILFILCHTISQLLFLYISYFSRFLSSFSHDTLLIDYATSWQICVVLATVSYSRTRRLSPIANYIRSLLHLGESRVPRGFPILAERAGPAKGVQGGQGSST